jgi:hypothetical protein
MKRALSLLVLASATTSIAQVAEAQPQHSPMAVPSTFTYGFHGFLLGAGAGLCVGYLDARSGGWHADDWRSLAYGASIGALAGGVLGVGLGIADLVADTPGRGYFVIRDGGYGLGFGLVTGAIAGSIAAIGSKDAQSIAVGAAIGGLIGTAGGLVLGIVEAQRFVPRRTAMTMTLAAAPSASGGLLWMPALVGRY